MTELKPCPFCGGDILDIIPADIILGIQYWKIHCYGCGCTQTPVSNKEDAIEKWNTRPNPWHTGTPTEEGDYLVAVSYYPLIQVEYQINRYLLEPYNDFIYQIEGEGRIVAWQKIEPYKKESR